MQVEEIKQKKEIQERKHHVEPTDPTIIEMGEKYELTKGDKKHNALANIDPIDVFTLLDSYANDVTTDLYTLADTFHISNLSLYQLLKNESFKEYYLVARKKRGDLLAQEGYKMVSMPVDMLLDGQDVNPMLIKACKAKANYCLAMAKSYNDEYNPTPKDNGQAGQAVSVVVNTAVQLKV